VNSYKSRGIPFAAGRELLPGANGETAFSSRVRGERGDFVNPFAVRIVDGTLVARAVIRDIKERKKRKEKEKKKKKEKGKKKRPRVSLFGFVYRSGARYSSSRGSVTNCSRDAAA